MTSVGGWHLEASENHSISQAPEYILNNIFWRCTSSCDGGCGCQKAGWNSACCAACAKEHAPMLHRWVMENWMRFLVRMSTPLNKLILLNRNNFWNSSKNINSYYVFQTASILFWCILMYFDVFYFIILFRCTHKQSRSC